MQRAGDTRLQDSNWDYHLTWLMIREEERGAEDADADKGNMRRETVQDMRARRTDKPDTELAGKGHARRNQMRVKNRMKSRM